MLSKINNCEGHALYVVLSKDHKDLKEGDIIAFIGDDTVHVLKRNKSIVDSNMWTTSKSLWCPDIRNLKTRPYDNKREEMEEELLRCLSRATELVKELKAYNIESYML